MQRPRRHKNIVWPTGDGFEKFYGFVGGWGSGGEIKSVMGLGTGQRNIAAALVVAGQNFGMDVLSYLMVIAIIGLVILMPMAGEIGKRVQGPSSSDTNTERRDPSEG